MPVVIQPIPGFVAITPEKEAVLETFSKTSSRSWDLLCRWASRHQTGDARRELRRDGYEVVEAYMNYRYEKKEE